MGGRVRVRLLLVVILLLILPLQLRAVYLSMLMQFLKWEQVFIE